MSSGNVSLKDMSSSLGGGHPRDRQYSYQDLAHPSLQEVLRNHNASTFKLVKTVAEFAQRIAAVHEAFATQLHEVVDIFKKRSKELKAERSADYPSTMYTAWESLLQETDTDSQAHVDIANLLLKNVYNPLLEVTSYKKSQTKKLYTFRENYQHMVEKNDEILQSCHNDYVDSYQRWKDNGRDASKFLSAYYNAHNDYVLQLRASNTLNEEYVMTALPYLLEELQEINIDIGFTLNGSIESLVLLSFNQANDQKRRWESILKLCKQVNPKTDVSNFVLAVMPEILPYDPKQYQFVPSDENENLPLRYEVVIDKHTEGTVKSKRSSLQKEAGELITYLKQNQDIVTSLMNVCQRNLANHLYGKVYETQEDLCRKRNDIRMANLQLASIRAQDHEIQKSYFVEEYQEVEIELLSPKQNGSVEGGGCDRESKKAQTASIKGMWKKAFRSLKKKDSVDEPDKQEVKQQDPKYSRLSLHRKSLLKRRESRDSEGEAANRDFAAAAKGSDEPDDPVYSLLKCAAKLPRGIAEAHTSGIGQYGRDDRRGEYTTQDSLDKPHSSRSSSPSSVYNKERGTLTPQVSQDSGDKVLPNSKSCARESRIKVPDHKHRSRRHRSESSGHAQSVSKHVTKHHNLSDTNDISDSDGSQRRILRNGKSNKAHLRKRLHKADSIRSDDVDYSPTNDSSEKGCSLEIEPQNLSSNIKHAASLKNSENLTKVKRECDIGTINNVQNHTEEQNVDKVNHVTHTGVVTSPLKQDKLYTLSHDNSSFDEFIDSVNELEISNSKLTLPVNLVQEETFDSTVAPEYPVQAKEYENDKSSHLSISHAIQEKTNMKVDSDFKLASATAITGRSEMSAAKLKEFASLRSESYDQDCKPPVVNDFTITSNGFKVRSLPNLTQYAVENEPIVSADNIIDADLRPGVDETSFEDEGQLPYIDDPQEPASVNEAPTKIEAQVYLETPQACNDNDKCTVPELPPIAGHKESLYKSQYPHEPTLADGIAINMEELECVVEPSPRMTMSFTEALEKLDFIPESSSE